MNHIEIGSGDVPTVVFGHGWGRSHRDFIPVAEAIAPYARSLLLDLPGFGETPRPPQNWGSADYADHVAAFVRQKTTGKIIWVGHSYGGRIGLRLGVRHPDLLSGMVLVAAAGVPMQKSLLTQVKSRIRQMQFKWLKSRAADQKEIDALEDRFGSPDYVQSRKTGMRDIFLAAIREDQSPDLHRITVPTTFIYGSNDTETPVETGRRMQALIAGAELVECPEFDHIGVLDRGRHQIALSVKEMLKGAAQ